MGIKRGVLELNSRALVNLEIRNIIVGLNAFGSVEWAACKSFFNWEERMIRWTMKKKKKKFVRICTLQRGSSLNGSKEKRKERKGKK